MGTKNIRIWRLLDHNDSEYMCARTYMFIIVIVVPSMQLGLVVIVVQIVLVVPRVRFVFVVIVKCVVFL